MNILKNSAREKSSRQVSSHFLKGVAAIIFSTLIIIDADAQKTKPNYGGIKDSLKTYIADCFIKEIMQKNTPGKIRNTMAYVRDNALSEDEAADYLIGELILKVNAENLKCEYQDPDSSDDKKRLLWSTRAAANQPPGPVKDTTITNNDTIAVQTSKPADQNTTTAGLTTGPKSTQKKVNTSSGKTPSNLPKKPEDNPAIISDNASGEKADTKKVSTSQTAESDNLFVAKFKELSAGTDKVKVCREMQDFINANADKVAESLPKGREADLLRQELISAATTQITVFYDEKLNTLQKIVQTDDLFALDQIDFVAGNSGDIQNGPDDVYRFYEEKELVFEHAKRVTSTQKLIAKAFDGTGIDTAGKNLNLAKHKFSSFGTSTHFTINAPYDYTIILAPRGVINFTSTKELIRTANLINYLKSMGRGNLKDLKSPRPFVVEDDGNGFYIEINTSYLTEATIVTPDQMAKIYPFLQPYVQGNKIQAIIDYLNDKFEVLYKEAKEKEAKEAGH